MSWRTILILLVLADFGAYSAYVLYEVGYLGTWEAALASPGAVQVTADLVIACVLIRIWMLADARARGTNPWPYVVITAVAGTFGPLLCFLRRKWARARARDEEITSAHPVPSAWEAAQQSPASEPRTGKPAPLHAAARKRPRYRHGP